MSYQVIARKYRPQRFEDVVGQEHVTQTLANAITAGRIAHAYLFCGPRGTGKTTIARIFAKALNCTGGPRADFDNDDPRCREITEGRALDVLEIDGASNNGVEQVRELRETARFAPASSQFKIYIIDEVHMLSTAAFNALLKTLEEPPAHVKFLFATTDPEKVLPTILSRCQRFDLRRIPAALIVKHLALIASQEGVQIDEAALHAIARGAEGGMRDAESTLDQLISFCGNRIEESDVLSMFGLAARSQVRALTRAILETNAPATLRELDELARGGKDLGRLLHDLIEHFRNLAVLLILDGDLTGIEVSEAEALELKQQAGLAPADAVTRVLEILSGAEGRLRDATSRKIFFEVTLLKAIQARNAVSLDTVLQQVQRLRQEAGGSGPAAGNAIAAPAPPPVPSPVPAAIPSSSPRPEPARRVTSQESQGGSSPMGSMPAAPTVPESEAVPAYDPASNLGVLWEKIVAGASPITRPSLQAGQVVGLEKGILTVGYAAIQESQRLLADQERIRKSVEAKLAELGCPARVRFVAQPGGGPGIGPQPVSVGSESIITPPRPATPEGAATPAPARRARVEKVVPIKVDPAEFKNDPLIKEALELFKGQLVEVRSPSVPDANAMASGGATE